MDYQTLLIVLIGLFCLQALGLLITWLQNRNEDGTREWAMGSLFMALGAGVVLALGSRRELSPALQSVSYGGIALVATGWLFLWAGIRRFLNHRSFSLHFLGLFFIVFYITLFLQQFLELPSGWLLLCLASVISAGSLLIIYEFIIGRRYKGGIARFMMIGFAVTALAWGAKVAWLIGALGQPLGGLYEALLLLEAILASTAATLGMILLTSERIHQHLREQAYIDSLTGLYNRRAFHEASRAVIAAAEREGEPVALALLDMDHFKRINDSFGHGVGDKVLMRFANLAELTFRDQDVLARFGGEEFVVLLPGADAEQAMQALQRLRRRLETECIEYQGQCVPSTVSIGVSCQQGKHIDLHAMIEEADKALYDAKRAGRNRVIMYHIDEALVPG